MDEIWKIAGRIVDLLDSDNAFNLGCLVVLAVVLVFIAKPVSGAFVEDRKNRREHDRLMKDLDSKIETRRTKKGLPPKPRKTKGRRR